MYHCYSELLPVEVNQFILERSLQEGKKRGIPFSALYSAKEEQLLLIHKQMQEILPSFPINLIESTYMKHRRNLAILDKELQEIQATYPGETPPFRWKKIHEEIHSLFAKWLPLLCKHYESLSFSHENLYERGLIDMKQLSFEALSHRVKAFSEISEEKKKNMQEEIEQFIANLIEKKGPLFACLQQYGASWQQIRLQTGRGLLITDTYDPSLSLLLSPDGTWYPLFMMIGNVIGVGTQKTVLRTVSIPDGKCQAIITSSPFNSKEYKEERRVFEQMWKEASFLRSFKDTPGIVHIHHILPFALADRKELFLIEDYYAEGSLDHYFLHTLYSKKSSKKGTFSKEQKEKIVLDLLEGLQALHAQEICHNDIKPDNILLRKDKGQLLAALSDFHLAYRFVPGISLILKTPRAAWAPPEHAESMLAARRKEVSITTSPYALDVWGLGIVFLILLTEELPFWIQDILSEKMRSPSQDLDKAERDWIIDEPIFKKVAALSANWLPEKAQKCPYSPLLRAMLAKDPKRRSSAAGALALFRHCL